ncbi:MAG: DinB family protein [bacterium]|nr:DinB family protein [bacterium]
MSIKFYQQQFEQVWNGVPWYGIPFEKTLNDLKEKDVFKKDAGFTHSIAEVLVHVNAWRNNMLEMLKGNGNYAIEPDSELDWSKKVVDYSWKELLDETNALQSKLLDTLESTSDEILTQTVPERKYNFDYLINGTIQHDIYHLGQIRQMHRFYNKD